MDFKIIKVIIADQCKNNIDIISDIIKKKPDIKAVTGIVDGNKLISAVGNLKPDVILLGVNFSDIDIVQITKQIMAFSPTPILIISNSKFGVNAKLAFEAVCCGAVDIIEKNDENLNHVRVDFNRELVEKIRLASKVQVIRRTLPVLKNRCYDLLKKKNTLTLNKDAKSSFVVGIGASTGGPIVLFDLIEKLPKNFNFSVLIVQHIVSSFIEELVSWIAKGTNKKVKLAINNELMKQNTCYIAPGDCHMKVSSGGIIKLSDAPPCNCHKPSVTVLFKSIAKHMAERSIGVILTGMGSDGLDGLEDMHKKRIPIIAQDEASSAIFGMPKACIDKGFASSIVSNEKISAEIMYYYSKYTGGKK